MDKQSINLVKFAEAGGVTFAAVFALSTVMSLLNVPGFPPFNAMLSAFYGPYGYSVSWAGVVVGAFWGFLEGAVWFGIFATVYNWLLKRK